MAFSPDGRTLASGSVDQTVRLWEMNVDRAIQRVCATTTNTLTPENWKHYVSRARVLHINGQPIPGLYAAGELGSIWGTRYQTSTNFAEALIYGKIASHTAARAGLCRPVVAEFDSRAF